MSAAEHPPAVLAALAASQNLLPERREWLRWRMRWVLFAISALGSTGYIAAVTVGTLAAAEMAGSASLGGIPSAAAVLGTAVAATVLSAAMLRVGRRPGLLAGLTVGVVGAVVAVSAVTAGSIPLLLFGAFLCGVANGSANLGRYVAADLVPPARRASAIGTVVWGSTIGAVAGPNLVAPAGGVASALGLPELSGAFVLTATFIGLALILTFVLLRPEPYGLADPSALAGQASATTMATTAELLRRPPVLVALVSLVAGQVVMVLIMTMTPIHLVEHGHDLATVGLVLSAHTFGMFALSPVSGRLTDRYGSGAIIGSGFVVLAAAALLAALAPPEGGIFLTVALFLLGWGWNLGFVAGSTLLIRGLALGERTRVQGIADASVWGSAAVAGLSSGMLVAGASYTALGLLGAGLLVLPAAFLSANRIRIRQLAR